MSNLALQNSLRHFAGLVRLHELIPADVLEQGLAHLEAEIERVALDAYSARRREIQFADAVADVANYPHLARLHTAVDDVLTLSLPAPVVSWLKSLLAMSEPPDVEPMRRGLVATAAQSHQPHLQALAEFVLFEGVRLRLVLMTKWFPHETFGVGLELADIDRLAEEHVRCWLGEGVPVPSDVRPLHLIVAAATESLTAHTNALRTGLALLQSHITEATQFRARVEAALSTMDVKDALLIRNEHAEAFDEQQFSVELLQERHLVLAGVSRNALDQRLRRTRNKTHKELRRRGVALLDLLQPDLALGGAR